MNDAASAAWPDAAVEGPAYPISVKSIATVLVAALFERGWRLLGDLSWAALGAGSIGLLAGGLLVVAVGWWEILTSRTALDATAIRQRSLWPREAKLADITQLKLVQIPGFAWIVVPRLVVRTRGLGFATFRAGDARLLNAFRRLAYGG